MTSIRQKIPLISLVSLILLYSYMLTSINYAFTTFISGSLATQELENLVDTFHSIENINDLLIDTTVIQDHINSIVGSYGNLSFFGLILATLTVAVILLINVMKNNVDNIIKSLIPKLDFLSHFQLITTVVFGVFMAIAASYLSLINFILLLRDQTITTIMSMTIIENPQPEITISLLSTYLANNMGEYLSATQGFYYFAIALLFPGLALIHYQLTKKLDFWNIVFITSTIFTIPFWIIQEIKI